MKRFVPRPGSPPSVSMPTGGTSPCAASRVVSRRQGPDRHTGQRPSARSLKVNEVRNKVHHRVADLRAGGLYKITTYLAAEYGHVVVEDLNVSGMLGNRRRARKIADAG